MTIFGWCLLGLVVCLVVLASCGLLKLIDDCKVGAGGRFRAQASSGTDGNACADVFPREWVISRPYDRENGAA